ncbi:MAG: hypothetical protein LGB78_09840 [Sulfurovum sp.]|nr:hypothetical protein [Sulfurovum sp.]MCB4748584.1 hypothetical protein [Sulfurovum sp.]MCB4761962.1 hypothetical protein [Sulfurovum sp.]MCB4764176.1 hypothetical protein [Sulfurovum sp.]MCB4773305.1 hypothetical protein [Sulfurovum sp.]
MPLDINIFSDVGTKKVVHLKLELKLIEQKKTINQEYVLPVHALRMYRQKDSSGKKG